ncbi:MAG TPA: hypothetical protein VF533_18530 [Solirubrobacteraceae bacterium]|jgi:hypothetical protein
MDEQQRQAFEQAVERKNEAAKAKSIANQPHPPADAEEHGLPVEESPLVEDGRTQDVRDVRAKNSGHGQVTADKWNQ